jgi:trehalose/maltose hydrolase-like predicted phosphorylase
VLARRFEAAILDWDGTPTPVAGRARGRPAHHERELVELLCASGFVLAVVGDAAVDDLDGRLRARPQGPGRLYLCPGRAGEVYAVDQQGPQLVHRGAAGAAREWVVGELWRHGISPGSTLVAGEELRNSFVSLLEDQLARRKRGELPVLDEDPAWTIAVDGVGPDERINESLLTLADGRIGTRGSPIDGHPSAAPGVRAAGVYSGQGPEEELIPLPLWHRLSFDLRSRDRVRRVLDLRTGLMRQDIRSSRRRASAVLLSSLAEPGTLVLRAEASRRLAKDTTPLDPDSDVRTFGPYAWSRRHGNTGGVLALARDRWTRRRGDLARLDRVAVYASDARSRPAPAGAVRRLRAADASGFDGLLAGHRAAWAARWEGAAVSIDGDAELERAVRFCLFHLMASVADRGEAPLGARGVSGPAYRGHVFWDSDVFGLPFFAATHPASARAQLEYRVRRLPAARRIARSFGHSGARFPWESAGKGMDVTPTEARDASGAVIPILTGQREEHITADVAWAAATYVEWTGDTAFGNGPGRSLLVETARYWASRIRIGDDGRGHIEGVIGPDEYHEDVDDNAYTNVMARWNLRRAAADAGDEVPGDERETWLRTADALVDGYRPESGLYEQFAGFFDLEPIVIADVAPRRPIAGDLLLGRDRVAGAQVVKQADVLMLHHLVPDEVVPGSLVPNLAFYEPRTAHGSSLSPALHAALLARVGRLEEAVEWLRVAAHIDLDDATGTTAGGLHMATMGGVWQALAFGFGGLRPRGEVLEIDPRLPERWGALELRICFRGVPARIRIERDVTTIEATAPLQVSVGGRTHGPAALHRLHGNEGSGEGEQ